MSGEYINPEVAVSPQKAFYAEKKSLSIKDSVGCISGEFVMCYPPGIPILAPGERITKEIAEYILYAKEKDAPCREPKIRQWNIFRYWHEWQQEVKICKCGFRNIIQLM